MVARMASVAASIVVACGRQLVGGSYMTSQIFYSLAAALIEKLELHCSRVVLEDYNYVSILAR